jgi:twitching motility protein PilT
MRADGAERGSTCLDGYLAEVLARNATDLHLAVGAIPRIRVDGVLEPYRPETRLTDQEMSEIISALFDPRILQRFDREHRADFSVEWRGQARFRVHAYSHRGRPALTFRMIPQQVPTLADLGLPPVVGELLRRPYGLVLVTGPTGSGKSTSLAAMIGWINEHRPVHVLTIEDPVEYVHQSQIALVTQREVGVDCFSTVDALRSAMREDPDVILVGEMRDLETMSLVMTLAETGHLVFATLHTNDAAQTVDRIVDAFPAEQQNQIRAQLAMTLAAAISQRLVPCHPHGRVAAFEVLIGTPAVSNLIREGKVRQLRNVISTSQRDGMVLLEQSLSRLVQQGTVRYEDAVAVSVHGDEILRVPSGSAGQLR